MPDIYFTILTYNIHHGEGRDGIIDLKRLSDVITAEAPDLVSLQEVDRLRDRSGYVDQMEDLAQLTDMQAVFGAAIGTPGKGQYGNAILSRYPIIRHKTYPLPGEPRSLLEAHIQLAGISGDNGELVFYATHLDLEQQYRLQSARQIRKIVTSFPGRIAILAGDLNATPGSPTIANLSEFWTNSTAGLDLVTLPEENGENRGQIDYIMYRPRNRWNVLEATVLEEPVASDHYALLVRLHLMDH
jgi:endonuclease/exonuclease/phosphatase family metal-dependent hydrolase